MSNPFYDDEQLNDDFSLEDDDAERVVPNNLDWYKAEKGRVDRVAFVYFHTVDMLAVKKAVAKNPKLTMEEREEIGKKALEARAKELGKDVADLTPAEQLDTSSVRFRRFKTHYYHTPEVKLGYVISRLGKDGPDADQVWAKLGEPRDYFTTLLLVYPTTRDGSVHMEALKQGKWRLIPWRLTSKLYRQIAEFNRGLRENGMSVASQDIIIKCEDTDYQKITLNLGGPAILRKSKNFQNKVLERAVELYGKLNPFREITTDELREKFGLAPSEAGGAEDFAAVLENV